MTSTDDIQVMLKGLHAQIEESHRMLREQREELIVLRARVELLSSRESELQSMLFQTQDQLVRSQTEARSLREQAEFMASTRAWKLGERYVHTRNRVLGVPRSLRGRGLRGKLRGLAEGSIDLGIVLALVTPLLFLPSLLVRLVRGLSRLGRSTAA